MGVYAKPRLRLNNLSYSSVSQYAECGEKFRLSKVFGLDNSTWWTTVMGTAVHYVTEQYDLASAGWPVLSDETTPESFHAVFDREVKRQGSLGVEILSSGKVLKEFGKTGGPSKKDRAWCEHYGPKFVQAWIDWRKSKNYRVAFMPGGVPGVEYEVDSVLGGVRFRGFIDRIFETCDGGLVVVDLKTGSRVPPATQLQMYAALLRLRGLDVEAGAFWKAADGDVAGWVDTPPESDVAVGRVVGEAVRGLAAGVFMPNVTSMCKGCTVRGFCAAVGGAEAGLVGPAEPVVVALSDEVNGSGVIK